MADPVEVLAEALREWFGRDLIVPETSLSDMAAGIYPHIRNQGYDIVKETPDD